MKEYKNYVLIGIAVVLAALVGSLTGGESQTVVEKLIPGGDSNVGAVSGPDIPYNYIGVGGIREYTAKDSSLTTATTTVCALQSPVATSTLTFGSLNLTTSSTTASTVVAAKAATQYATTTFLFGDSVSANAQLDLVATTTTNDYVFGPSEWLVFGMSGGAGTFSPVGTCQASWKTIL